MTGSDLAPINVLQSGESGNPPPSTMSLDSLLMLIHSERLKTLRDQATDEFKELSKRQEDVRALHEVQKAINNATDDKGTFKVKDDENLKDLIKKAEDLGVKVDCDKSKYSKEERDRLVENLKMTIEDLNVKNNMQLDVLSRLHTERLESFQLARAILKPLDDDKRNKARKISGN